MCASIARQPASRCRGNGSVREPPHFFSKTRRNHRFGSCQLPSSSPTTGTGFGAVLTPNGQSFITKTKGHLSWVPGRPPTEEAAGFPASPGTGLCNAKSISCAEGRGEGDSRRREHDGLGPRRPGWEGSGGQWWQMDSHSGQGTDHKGGPGAWPGQLGASLTRAPTSPGVLLGPRSLG